jgi:hypothetical protein
MGTLRRVAIISDIHGNVTALTAVLADIDARGISTIVNLGDVAGKGPRGSEAVRLSGRRIRLFHASAESVHTRVHFEHTAEEFEGAPTETRPIRSAFSSCGSAMTSRVRSRWPAGSACRTWTRTRSSCGPPSTVAGTPSSGCGEPLQRPEQWDDQQGHGQPQRHHR